MLKINSIKVSVICIGILFVSSLSTSAYAAKTTYITYEMAKKIYMETCSVCHSEFGDGRTHAVSALKVPPRNFTDPRVKEKLTEELMINTVTEGSPGTAMISWKYDLSTAEIKAVITFIRAEFMKLGKYPQKGIAQQNADIEGESSKTASSGGKITGNIEEGKKIYIKNCSPCHGEKGDGKGLRYAFIFPQPRKFTDQYEMKNIDKDRMINSVTKGRQGSQMMSWEGILTKDEINNVVDYIIVTFLKKDAK